MYSAGSYSVPSSQLSMTDCTLSNNRAGSEGGGICVFYTRTKIDGCTLSSNTAPAGSAIYDGSGGAYMAIVNDSLFSRNNNSAAGGAIDSAVATTVADVSHSVFTSIRLSIRPKRATR